MGSQRSPKVSSIASASAATALGGSFATAAPYPASLLFGASPRLRAFLKEVISSNRGRLALLACWDLVAVTVAVNSGYFVSPRYDFQIYGHIGLWKVIWPLGIAFVVSGLSLGLYERPNGEGKTGLLIRTTIATVLAWAVALLSQYAVKFAATGRWVVLISGMVLICLTLLGRLILRHIQRRMPINVIVLGDEQIARSIQVDAERRHFPPVRVLAAVPMARDIPVELPAGVLNDSEVCGQHRANWIVVQGTCDGATLEELLPFFQNGTRVANVSTFFESLFQKVPVEVIDGNWLIQANVSLVLMASRVIKRAADILTSLTGLVITLPLWPAIAVGIKLSSKGPVFYRQERVGRHGKVFSILKFRTMTVNAEPSGKAVWADRRDKRVTTVGRFLRKTRLDELPQFINVLLGDMSLIGPRPERLDFVQFLTEKVPHYRLRHLVRPGVTGWAQISYRYAASLDDSIEKLKYDLYYVKHGGILLDLQIMMRTVGVLMRGSR